MKRPILHSPTAIFCAIVLKRFTIAIVAAFTFLLALPLFAQQATVDITPGHSTNSFSPLQALGAASIAIR